MTTNRFIGKYKIREKKTENMLNVLSYFFLVYLTICMVMLILIEQSYGIYVDCRARCWLTTRRERNRDTLQMCRDECEILELLQKEDAREGKAYNYRQFK